MPSEDHMVLEKSIAAAFGAITRAAGWAEICGYQTIEDDLHALQDVLSELQIDLLRKRPPRHRRAYLIRDVPDNARHDGTRENNVRI